MTTSYTVLVMRAARFTTVAAPLLLAASCTAAPPPDTRAADEQAIRKADAEWAKAAQSKSVDAWAAFYSDDAVVLPPNEAMSTGMDNIKKAMGGLLGLPNLAISWQSTKVEVARGGDLAYLYGTYEVSYDESPGKRVTDRGKLVEVWRKQADGSWKCIVDTWNSDLPAAPAPPAV
jgi:ketosteroid isomerase-like protein